MLRVSGSRCVQFKSRWNTLFQPHRASSKNLRYDTVSSNVTASQTKRSPLVSPTIRSFSSENNTSITYSTDALSTAEQQMNQFEEFAQESTQSNSIEIGPVLDTPDWSSDYTWYYPQDSMINLINYVQETSDMNYALSIVATTLAIRFVLSPIQVIAQRNSSRVAHMMPEMNALKEKIEKIDKKDQRLNLEYSKKMQSLFQKYDCNPLKSALPILQMPVFVSLFFGTRKMPDYFPEELSNGGMAWFTDLTAADPYMILPVASSLTFLAMTEMNKEQMLANNPKQAQVMITAMRVLSLVAIPIAMNFEAAVLCYFATNNTFSLVQTGVMKHPMVKKSLGIWDPPPPVPGSKQKDVFTMMKDGFKDRKEEDQQQKRLDKIKMHNAAIDANLLQKSKRQVKQRKKRR